jgi:outer membrane protein assembly factor BamD (BamD/ComL family)
MALRPLAALALAGFAAAGCASTGLEEPTPVDAATLRAAEALFQQAEALRSKQDFDDARDLYRDMRDAYPGSPLAAEAQFLEAECAYADRSWAGAGELFAKFAEDRPFSRHLPIVEKRLFEIGQWLIEDGKRGFLGLGILSTSDQGIALLRRQQILLPTGVFADDALFRVGTWYAENHSYEDAQVVLQDLVRSYPSSEWRLAARFLLGWAYRHDNRGAEYDGEKLRRARAQYMEFVSAASSDPARAAEYAKKIAAAREAVDEIDGVLATKALARARLYRRVGNDTAAVFVLKSAAARWGNTAPGQECARQADSLSREVQAAAVPAPAAGGPAPNGGP